MLRYLKNKKELYEALVEIGYEKLIVNHVKSESPMEFFKKQIEWYLAVATSNNFAARMFVFMGLVAINAQNVSVKAIKMYQELDIESMRVPYIVKGQEMKETR